VAEANGSGARRRRGRARFVALALLIALGVQIPLVLTVGRLLGHRPPVMALGAALTAGFLSNLLGPRSLWGAPGRLRLYGTLWPFFIWWTVALLFLFIAPLALLASRLFSIATDPALAVGLLVAALGAASTLGQRPRLQQRDIFIAGLPAAFEGFRIAQISDLHCGPFASGPRVSGWIAAVNRLEPDLIAVTGDLIASGAAFVPVVASALGQLRAPHGVFASMGNHDYFTEPEALAQAIEAAGLTLLRNRGIEVGRGDARIFVAGVDDTWTRRNDLERTLAERPAGMPTVLLAHDPALFPDAAARGVDLTLSGHTHGGQLGLPFFSRKVNLARLMTRFTSGFYQLGSASLYVNRGLGTTGPPVRLGVSPEIGVLTLRRAPAEASAAEVGPVGLTSLPQASG
jgi:predicted MPP superfamily phosphohydrolase